MKIADKPGSPSSEFCKNKGSSKESLMSTAEWRVAKPAELIDSSLHENANTVFGGILKEFTTLLSISPLTSTFTEITDLLLVCMSPVSSDWTK